MCSFEYIIFWRHCDDACIMLLSVVCAFVFCVWYGARAIVCVYICLFKYVYVACSHVCMLVSSCIPVSHGCMIVSSCIPVSHVCMLVSSCIPVSHGCMIVSSCIPVSHWCMIVSSCIPVSHVCMIVSSCIHVYVFVTVFIYWLGFLNLLLFWFQGMNLPTWYLSTWNTVTSRRCWGKMIHVWALSTTYDLDRYVYVYMSQTKYYLSKKVNTWCIIILLCIFFAFRIQ